MVSPFGDLRALRIHASLSTSRLFAFPWMKSTMFSIHPWKYTSAMALTSLLFQKLREFCALKSAKISWPVAVLALSFPPPARTLSSSGPRTTASEAAESWTTRCWWDISRRLYRLQRGAIMPGNENGARQKADLLSENPCTRRASPRIPPVVRPRRLIRRRRGRPTGFSPLPGRPVTVAGGRRRRRGRRKRRRRAHPPAAGSHR